MNGRSPVEPRGDSGAALRRLTERIESLLGDRGDNPAVRRKDVVNILSDAIATALIKPLKTVGTLYSSKNVLGRVGAIIEDQKPSGTGGGTFTLGADRTRDLTIFVNNDLGLPPLTANRFTLSAGKWFIAWSCPANRVDEHRSLLYNVTAAAIVQRGSSEFGANGIASASQRSVGSAIITLTAPAQFELRHRSNNTWATFGFGVAHSLGTEVYSRVEITKIAA